jgi:hypothetical protein
MRLSCRPTNSGTLLVFKSAAMTSLDRCFTPPCGIPAELQRICVPFLIVEATETGCTRCAMHNISRDKISKSVLVSCQDRYSRTLPFIPSIKHQNMPLNTAYTDTPSYPSYMPNPNSMFYCAVPSLH